MITDGQQQMGHISKSSSQLLKALCTMGMFLHSQAELPVQNQQTSPAPGAPPLPQEMRLIPSEVMEKLNRGTNIGIR